MAADELFFVTVRQLRQWASTKPRIRRLWVYGSRLRGTQRPDSDLDVAVEIDPLEAEDDRFAAWTFESETWRAELRSISPFAIQLEWYGGTATPRIAQYLGCCSMLVYERLIEPGA